ncbi:PTS lactose/cellobiose transporter subunit IIA [Fundicoccus culcitae]|uniref:PTS lactose/cellobiose transporter subunit IIA n=1 Tax=Fundicoccus culcitae TaxID=2969821 RepID=A0ABY5P308_9LACT|nr:PTS lactose/cellobiose transporter subunit IIA [Fundicoccus culcitae]UUX33112.1 PTS lactose/cellobiose transporter subunit IIA [Fundicoccus culcitae]
MSEPENLEEVMGLIMYGGDAKGKAIEAIEAAKSGDFDLAEEKMAEANESLVTAHKSQTSLLTSEAEGDNVEISLLLIHGQDHLMNAITFVDLAKEMVDIYRKLRDVEK